MYKDGQGEIRDFQEKVDNGIVIFNGENIEKMYLDVTGTKVVIWYKNKKIKIIDLKECDEVSS